MYWFYVGQLATGFYTFDPLMATRRRLADPPSRSAIPHPDTISGTPGRVAKNRQPESVDVNAQVKEKMATNFPVPESRKS